jgi:hypothetical protein
MDVRRDEVPVLEVPQHAEVEGEAHDEQPPARRPAGRALEREPHREVDQRRAEEQEAEERVPRHVERVARDDEEDLASAPLVSGDAEVVNGECGGEEERELEAVEEHGSGALYVRGALRVNSRSAMSRVVLIVVVFLAILGVSWWQLSMWFGDDASRSAGRSIRIGASSRRSPSPIEPVRTSVWLGDSTIMTTDDAAPPYPVLLDRRAIRPAGYSSQVVAAPGLDFYAYYALMGPALATRPRLVVMVANLRLFNPAGFRSFNDLVGFVPWPSCHGCCASLRRTRHDRTQPRAGAARRNGARIHRTAARRGTPPAVGRHGMVGDARAGATGGPGWSVAERRERGSCGQGARVRAPDRSAPSPGSLRRSRRRHGERSGVRVLVVVSPMPLDVLREHQVFDERRIARGIDALRDAVTASGGTLVDLHAPWRRMRSPTSRGI